MWTDSRSARPAAAASAEPGAGRAVSQLVEADLAPVVLASGDELAGFDEVGTLAAE